METHSPVAVAMALSLYGISDSCVSKIVTQVATYKILDSLTPLLIRNNPYFASIRSTNCQFVHS